LIVTPFTSKTSLQGSALYSSTGREKSRKNLRKKTTLREVQEEPSYDSKNNSEVIDIQTLYQNYLDNPPPSALDKGSKVFESSPANNEPRKRYLTKITNVKSVYYNALKRRMGRRKSKIVADPEEFAQLIKTIHNDIRTPNEIRINDIAISGKSPLERLRDYKDKFPLLEARKQIMKIFR